MYLVTGGAGFIGSNLVAELCDREVEVAVCDTFGHDERWRNLAKHEVADLIVPEALPAWLDSHRREIEAVVHLGAISSTTESDVALIVRHNVRATLDLLHWCTLSGTRLIYASSAATYGDGGAGFDDDGRLEALRRLRPLNPYAWSKHVVDVRIARLRERRLGLPPQCAGLKFFNVYGPNEYHKGSMRSAIVANYERARRGEAIRLFRSGRPDYPDGGQTRDFVYVRDCVEVILWLLQSPSVSGLFNVGTGRARSWLDLATALFRTANRPVRVEFIDMPTKLLAHYQYCTQARLERLRGAGCTVSFRSLEEGIADYVGRYLLCSDPFR